METPADKNAILAKMQAYADAVDESQSKFDGAINLLTLLLSDTNELGKAVKTMGESQFFNRMSVKTQLTFCEGAIATMKEMLRQADPVFDPPLNEVEQGKLEDKLITRKPSGEVKENPWRPKMEANILFLSEILGRVKGCREFTIERDTDGWNTFFEAVEIRNRLTHPKPYAVMDVTDEEMETVRLGGKWLTEQLQRFIDVRKKSIRADKDDHTAALIAEARDNGATDEQIAAFLKRIYPSYTDSPAVGMGGKTP